MDPIAGLYATNASQPLGNRTGLRQSYHFGLYSHCGYVNESSAGSCSNHTIGRKYQPYEALTIDMRANYSTLTNNILETFNDHINFQDSKTLGNYTVAAYYLILLATIIVALAFILCVPVIKLTTFIH